MTERMTLTVEEAGQLLGIGRGTAYQAVAAGDLPSVRLGRRILIPRHALAQMLTATGTDSPQTNGAGDRPGAEKEGADDSEVKQQHRGPARR